MTKPRSNKALKTDKTQDVSAGAPQDQSQPSSYALLQEQQHMQFLLNQMGHHKGHLLALAQQHKDAESLLALALIQRADFLNALSNHGESEHWPVLEHHQRGVYVNMLMQQQQIREYLYCSSALQQQQPSASILGQQALLQATLPQQQPYHSNGQEAFMNHPVLQQQQSHVFGQAAFANAPAQQQPSRSIGQEESFMNGLVQQQQPVLPTSGSSYNTTNIPTITDPFQILGEDVHREVLSYIMKLKTGYARPPLTAESFYIRDQLDTFKANHPEISSWHIRIAMEKELQALSTEERSKWDELAEQDHERYRKEEASFVRPPELLETCTNLSLVSKNWRIITGEVMNSDAPVGIISQRDLFVLKARARKISLSTIGANFIKDIKEKWGGATLAKYDIDGERALDIVIQQFGGSDEAFANLVATEYLQFLVVKAVEAIAAHKYYDSRMDGVPPIMAWKEKCQPTLLVDLFWHAHMQAPQKYALDCNVLIGDMLSNGTDFSIGSIINHDAGYVSSNTHAGSDFESKRDMLFAFEKQFPSKDFFGGRLDQGGNAGMMLFTKKFNLRRVAAEIWQDMQGYNDCG